MLTSLADDLKRHISFFLSAPELLSLLCVHRNCVSLGETSKFWEDLLHRDSDDNIGSCILTNRSAAEGCASSQLEDFTITSAAEAKRAFLINARTNSLATVRWRAVRTTDDHNIHAPSSREGHLMCVLGPPSCRQILVTGGFSSDPCVHLLEVNNSNSSSTSNTDDRRWKAIQPSGQEPSFVYGATLTPIDDRRAIRFGGFSAGGYSNETNCCYLLVLEKNDDDDLEVRWERINVKGQPPPGRAYHTATLINDRYLVIIGGMKTRESILSEAILDVKTFTWIQTSITSPLAGPKPSGRHGHSVILNGHRNRLVLFGGGSGSDLLRSGVDNGEVWELKMNKSWRSNDLESSLPWTWQKIHSNDDTEEDEDENRNEEMDAILSSRLSHVELLNLGRCHIGVKISRDTVLFAFGSGRPPTNGVLAYNLQTDKFHRPRVAGPFPRPRFTAAATLLDSEGWLVTYGGYSVMEGGTLDDVAVLDLAPELERTFPSLATYAGDEEEAVVSFDPITDRHLQGQRRRPGGGQTDEVGIIMELMAARPSQRRDLAATILSQLMAQGNHGRTAIMLAMIANGNAVIGSEDDDSEEEEEDDI